MRPPRQVLPGRTRRVPLALLWFVALTFASPGARSQQPVDLELVLAVDCSYSVDSGEFALQMQGLAAAFRDPAVIAAIGANRYRAIAVTVVQWSGPDSQVVAVPWRRIHDRATALDLSARIAEAPRMTAEGATSISAMVRFGLRLLDGNAFQGSRRVIDISSDGRNNAGPRIRDLRAAAAWSGATLNGLAILNEVETLNYYFEKYVIAGPNAFVVTANDYDAFREAILNKIVREIGNLPTS
jgi:hypothetical protein